MLFTNVTYFSISTANTLLASGNVQYWRAIHIPAAVPPQAGRGSVLYLSPSLFLLKLLLQGLYPGTVVCIELTQTLAWVGGGGQRQKVREPGSRTKVEKGDKEIQNKRKRLLTEYNKEKSIPWSKSKLVMLRIEDSKAGWTEWEWAREWVTQHGRAGVYIINIHPI